MPTASEALPSDLVSRLKENIRRGRAARETLGRKLAEMSPREIAKLPRAVLTRIGPAGIATMARVAAGTDDALPAPKRAPVRMQSQDKTTSGPPPLWLVCCAGSALIVGLAILAGMVDRPLRWAVARSGYLSADAAGLCNRLDRWSENCNFVVTGEGFSLADIAARLGRDPSLFRTPSMVVGADSVLPVGTTIHVDRNPER
ncbi:hypothetical protein MTR72_24095 [Bradyrhizobium sp. ISRA442]|uniref:hypothetical protein n=1 Tax=Bradyrhizobium sp. ISRA442 TaxID=2866197 RepID=UPI00311B17B3